MKKTTAVCMADQCTPRKCAVCQRPADMWRYTLDKLGKINKSSRQPVCGEHSGLEAA